MTLRQWEITVNWNPHDTSPNRRYSRFAKARNEAKARETGNYCWQEAGKPRTRRKVRVSVLLRISARMDQQNVWGALKGVMDGIFVDALTPDDNPDWVELGVVVQDVKPGWRRREECVFTITEQMTVHEQAEEILP